MRSLLALLLLLFAASSEAQIEALRHKTFNGRTFLGAMELPPHEVLGTALSHGDGLIRPKCDGPDPCPHFIVDKGSVGPFYETARTENTRAFGMAYAIGGRAAAFIGPKAKGKKLFVLWRDGTFCRVGIKAKRSWIRLPKRCLPPRVWISRPPGLEPLTEFERQHKIELSALGLVVDAIDGWSMTTRAKTIASIFTGAPLDPVQRTQKANTERKDSGPMRLSRRYGSEVLLGASEGRVFVSHQACVNPERGHCAPFYFHAVAPFPPSLKRLADEGRQADLAFYWTLNDGDEIQSVFIDEKHGRLYGLANVEMNYVIERSTVENTRGYAFDKKIERLIDRLSLYSFSSMNAHHTADHLGKRLLSALRQQWMATSIEPIESQARDKSDFRLRRYSQRVQPGGN